MKTINCDLVLYPKFQDGWVVFDRWFYRNGKAIHKIIYDVNAKKPCRKYPSFNFQHALDYILSADKKEFRNKNDFFDSEISGSEYNKRITHLANHSESVYCVHNVKFSQSIFICPISGVVWKDEGFGKPWPFFRQYHVRRPWYFKTYKDSYNNEILFAPKGIIEALERDGDPVKRTRLGVKLWDYECVSVDKTTLSPTWKKVASSTAEYGYLSGLYEHGWGKYTGYRKKNYSGNPREFLRRLFDKDHPSEVYQEDIIKSAARHIKKISRIAPLSEATKTFFKNLGALAHLQKAAQYATQP
jgi:hypothetical protein